MWGPTGWNRLFLTSMGGQITWLIPGALIGLVAVLWLTRRAPRTDRIAGRLPPLRWLAAAHRGRLQLLPRHHPPLLHGGPGPGHRRPGGDGRIDPVGAPALRSSPGWPWPPPSWPAIAWAFVILGWSPHVVSGPALGHRHRWWARRRSASPSCPGPAAGCWPGSAGSGIASILAGTGGLLAGHGVDPAQRGHPLGRPTRAQSGSAGSADRVAAVRAARIRRWRTGRDHPQRINRHGFTLPPGFRLPNGTTSSERLPPPAGRLRWRRGLRRRARLHRRWARLAVRVARAGSVEAAFGGGGSGGGGGRRAAQCVHAGQAARGPARQRRLPLHVGGGHHRRQFGGRLPAGHRRSGHGHRRIQRHRPGADPGRRSRRTWPREDPLLHQRRRWLRRLRWPGRDVDDRRGVGRSRRG